MEATEQQRVLVSREHSLFKRVYLGSSYLFSMTHLSEVRTAIVKAVPGIRREGRVCPAQHAESFKIDCYYCEEGKNLRPIRLADVLRAILDGRYAITADFSHDSINLYSEAEIDGEYPNCSWKLAADSLDDQSPETITFLHSILCV